MEEIQTLIDDYILHNVSNKERSGVRTLLCDGESSFLKIWMETNDYEDAVRESVKALNNGKLTAVRRYKLFITWLSAKLDREIVIQWPEADVSSRFERMVAITRILQNRPPMAENEAVEYLSDRLWVSDRTIREDIRNLREGSDLYQFSALNQAFGIDRMSGNSEPIRFLSSVHPMLLLENMTGVVLMIEALLEKSEWPVCRDICLDTAVHCWVQLTDYARERVIDRINADFSGREKLLSLFEEMKARDQTTAFHSEQSYLMSIPNKWMHYMKLRQLCQIVWTDDRGKRKAATGYPSPQRGSDSMYMFESISGNTLAIKSGQIISIDKAR